MTPTLTPPNEPDNIIVLSPSRNTPEPTGPWSSPASAQIVPETPLLQQSSSNTFGSTPDFTDATTQTFDDYSTHISTLDLTQLRRSRRQAMTELENSTAEVNRLLVSGQILEAIKLTTQALVKQAEHDLVEARLKLVQAENKASKAIRKRTVASWIIGLIVLMFAIWSQYDSPDRIYIRNTQKQFWEGRD
ncbi:uncharacterized protein MYCFIDRAFT_82919 [Pseudocercospora fijiensis CIRAD86]|uniref:Uncharacterized protein n=1 Tax=Pseudocercospora fijiensis (strain CIRAD86) TaxID=383855 RepID=M3B648_PSEFD|nr:uncharacterized protein MYCFIDRAFT_82919 [Pseudocercospora fijiensis CIRAD86]EME84842.1 hypothetical protein MYCFIDRAFT_82919 [Pseudocercospora fijiensis CIRAD86]